MKIHGNILQEEQVNITMAGNKLKKYKNILQNAGNKLKKKGIDLKILGEETIFVEIFRNFEIRTADFLEYPKDIPDCGGTGKLGKGCIRIAKATIRIIA